MNEVFETIAEVFEELRSEAGEREYSVQTKESEKAVKEIKGLKPGKKYYVKVRTYKEVKSGTKKVRIYSDWSKKKAVQIKK